MIKCSVCINTYKRPFLLKKLLESLNRQVVDVNVEVEIIVVDNDPEKQAENIVLQASSYLRFPVFYYTQPIKNISLTRNVAVEYATGNYILFIDDDEYADINWIGSLLRTIQSYDADVVFGKVIPYFDENTPVWITKYGLFERPCGKTGEFPRFTYTSNCIIKSEVIKSVEGPFNPEYGITGGEDTFLFGILRDKGFKFVVCCKALVYDYVPRERTSLKWLLRRAFRTGNTYTRRTIQSSKNKIITKVILAFRAIIAFIFSFFMMIVTFFIPKYFIFWMLRISGKIGHLCAIFNYYHEEYKDVTHTDFSDIIRKNLTKNQL